MVKGYGKTGHYPTGKVVTGGTGKVVKGYGKTGHPYDLQGLIYKENYLQGHGLQHHRRLRRQRRAVTLCVFDWGRVSQDAAKFKAIPCLKRPDRQFLYKVIALTQASIPPFAVWDALEAVKQIGPTCPIAYFRTVLRDNCRKAGVDLDAALRTVRVPKNFV
jgi:hypothetical protein